MRDRFIPQIIWLAGYIDAKLADTTHREVTMEFVLMLFVLVGGSIAYSAWKKSKSPGNSQPVRKQNDPENGSSDRHCLACGYEGEMKTWLSHYKTPQVLVVIGFILFYIPGLIFIALYWGKYKCPSCGAVGKNQQLRDANPVV
jgi:hypothetical protein